MSVWILELIYFDWYSYWFDYRKALLKNIHSHFELWQIRSLFICFIKHINICSLVVSIYEYVSDIKAKSCKVDLIVMLSLLVFDFLIIKSGLISEHLITNWQCAEWMESSSHGSGVVLHSVSFTSFWLQHWWREENRESDYLTFYFRQAIQSELKQHCLYKLLTVSYHSLFLPFCLTCYFLSEAAYECDSASSWLKKQSLLNLWLQPQGLWDPGCWKHNKHK